MNKSEEGSDSRVKVSERPLVSVVMIAYNKEPYIEEAIKGVLKQRGDFDIELIIMDDCSTDGTPEIINKYAMRYPEIVKVYRNAHNLGLQRNYLEGFSHCSGRYMAICDADDYWFYKRKLARQIGYMERHEDCTVTFHRTVNYYEDSGEMSLSNGGTKKDTCIDDLCRSNYITNSSVVYRRDAVELSALPEWMAVTSSPDYAMHVFYATRGTIHFFGRPMGVYRKIAGSAWSTAGAFDSLKMSLGVRLNIIDYLGSEYPAASEGIKEASLNILRSMCGHADCDDRRRYVTEVARKLNVEASLPPFPESSDVINETKRKRPLVSRIRGFVSRMLPRPRP